MKKEKLRKLFWFLFLSAVPFLFCGDEWICSRAEGRGKLVIFKQPRAATAGPRRQRGRAELLGVPQAAGQDYRRIPLLTFILRLTFSWGTEHTEWLLAGVSWMLSPASGLARPQKAFGDLRAVSPFVFMCSASTLVVRATVERFENRINRTCLADMYFFLKKPTPGRRG